MVLGVLLAHWRRHPFQLAMLILGLALATALWSGVQAINAEARASYDRAAAELGGDRLARIVAEDGGMIAEAEYVALRRAGWLVSPLIEGDIRIGAVRLRLLGVEPVTLPGQARQGMADGVGFAAGVRVLYVSAATYERLRGMAGPERAVAEGVPPGTALADVGQAQRLLGQGAVFSRLLVAAEQPLGQRPLADVVPGLVLQAPDGAGDLARLTDSFHLNLTAFGFLAFAVGLFIVQSAIGLAFEQRRGMFRTLRALGVPLAEMMALLLAELLLLALLAGLIGIGLGWLVASALLPDVAATLRGLYGADVAGSLSLRPGWWAAGVGIAVAGTMAAAALHLWQVWRLPLLAPAQPQAWARGARQVLWALGLAAAGFLGVAAGILLFGSGLVAGFLVLAGLFLGAASGLPVVMAGLLALAGRRARGAVAAWFWADTRVQLPGLSLALAALMLALATNLGVGTMVESFRLTFVGWLDQRLASELYVAARDEAEAEAMRAWLLPQVDAVLPIWDLPIDLYGAPGSLYAVADHATYRDNWPLLAAETGVWDMVAAGQGVLINEQLFYRQGLELGAPVQLPGGWAPRVLGVYSDYGNMSGQVIVGLIALAAHYPDVSKLRFGIRVAPERAAALAEALQAQFDLPGTAVIDQAGIKALSLQVFERTFTVTAALNVLTLAVAGLAMFASLTALAGMRLPQVAPVWAMGLTRAALARLEFLRALMLAGLAMLVALPVGLGLAWVLLAVVNVEAFGWRLPLHLFPLDWLRLAGLGFLAAGLAAAVPVRRLARISPAALLAVFAHER